MRRPQLLVTIALVLSLLVTGASAHQPSASAADAAGAGGAGALSEVAPMVVEGDQPETTVRVAHSPMDRPQGDTGVDGAEKATPDVLVTTTPAESDPQSVEFTLDGATRRVSTTRGVSTFLTADRSVLRYVAESSDGARVVTSYERPRDTYESRTTFDFSGGERAERRDNGDWYLRRGSDIVGVIHAPWAVDARGIRLRTSYTWEGSTLVQSVVVPDGAVFPVVADPAWSYTWTAVVRIGSPGDVYAKMRECFNCVFPVEGAPRAFPYRGQVLPLVVRVFPGAPYPVNFTCIFGDSQVIDPNALFPGGDFAFWFNTGRGHVDGSGSRISFDWWTGSADPRPRETMRFTVYGSIVNERPANIPRSAYLAGAKTTWSRFVEAYVDRAGGQGEPFDWNWLN